MRVFLLLVMMAAACFAQQESALRQQQESVGKQLESLRRQNPSLWPVPLAPAAEDSSPAAAQCPPLPESRLRGMVDREAARQSVSRNLLFSVIEQESANVPCAVSQKGAMGLMQLMPATARMLEVKDPFDPDENVAAGSRYLKSLLERYAGDVPKALAAYNAGAGRVDQADQVPDIPETLQYVKKILSRFSERERRIE